MEEPTLTREQIEQAKDYRSTSHPALDFLAEHEAEMGPFNELYAKRRGSNAATQTFVKGFFAGFVEEFNSFPDFTLNPLELIAVWSKLDEIFPKATYPKYRMAAVLACVYGRRGIDNPEWKNLTENILLGSEFPEDKEGLLHFRERIKDISGSLGEIDFYLMGTRESFADIANKAFKDGDEEAKAKWEKLSAWNAEHKDPLLEQIGENWGNGMGWMYLAINHKLEQ